MKAPVDDKHDKTHFRVVIFGSARLEKTDPNWTLIYNFAKRLAEAGIDIVTGGGPGLMDAASEGHNAGDRTKNSQSIGLQIILPKKQRDAHHLDIKQEFSLFSERLDHFISLANVVVVAPGGVGTILEFFYTWQLLQVKMIRNIPIILLGEMWVDFLHWIEKWPLEHKFLKSKDIELLVIVNNTEDALKIIQDTYTKFKRTRGHSAENIPFRG
ncbi:LOG family protein [Candidatus Bathyarchaeota archaeon]|nr:LOG family protein [Candidatus Bathyarchaeota archaeon]